MNILAANTLAATPEEMNDSAVLDVTDFVRREGLLLHELLELAGDEDGADAALNLIALCAAPLPDYAAISAKLDKVKVALEFISILHLDDLVHSGAAPFDVHGAVCWVGARVEEYWHRMNQC